MARPGDQLENPVTGERIVFRRTASDTDGQLLELDQFWTRRGQRTVEHVHPQMEERWEVMAGVAQFRIEGIERLARPGDVLIAAPGTPHVGWNPGEAEVHLRTQFRPALRWEELVERLFLLAREGRTDEVGVPEPATLAELMREFHREIAAAPRTPA